MLLRSVRAIALLGSAEIALRGPRRAPSCRNFCNDTPVRASKPAKIRAPRDAAGTRRTVRRPKRWFAAAASRAPEVAPPRGSERSIFMLFRSVRAIALLRLAHNLGGGGRMRFFPDSPRNLEKSWESIIFRRFSIRLHRFSLKNNEKLSFSILGRSIFALFRSARALALPWCASPRGPERSLSSKGQRNRSLQHSKRPSFGGEGGWGSKCLPSWPPSPESGRPAPNSPISQFSAKRPSKSSVRMKMLTPSEQKSSKELQHPPRNPERSLRSKGQRNRFLQRSKRPSKSSVRANMPTPSERKSPRNSDTLRALRVLQH